LLAKSIDYYNWPRIEFNRLASQPISIVSFARIDQDSYQRERKDNERTYIYPIGFLWSAFILFVGLYHLRFPPRDGHAPRDQAEVLHRMVIGLTFVLAAGRSVPLTYWLASIATASYVHASF
jgi:hypothetical protein